MTHNLYLSKVSKMSSLRIEEEKNRIEEIRKKFNESRQKFSQSKVNEIRRNLYEIENKKKLFFFSKKKKKKMIEKNFLN